MFLLKAQHRAIYIIYTVYKWVMNGNDCIYCGTIDALMHDVNSCNVEDRRCIFGTLCHIFGSFRFHHSEALCSSPLYSNISARQHKWREFKIGV